MRRSTSASLSSPASAAASAGARTASHAAAHAVGWSIVAPCIGSLYARCEQTDLPANYIGLADVSSGLLRIITTAEMTLVHRPFLSPSAVCTTARVLTISPLIL